MTPPSRNHTWDDRRLEAAFATRAARARMPSDLIDETVAQVREAGRPALPWRRWLPAAALVLLVVVAGGVASFRFVPGPDPSSLVTPMPDAPAEVLGLSMRSVEDAIVIRDAGVDDRELAIKGWFSPVPPISCPAPATWPVTPVEPNCPDQWVVLMARPEVITTVEANGFVGGLPKGPSIQIDLDDLDMTWQPRLPDLGPAHPVEVVVIGHFDDRRAFACPAAVAAACRDRFVVDRVDRVGGIEQPTSEVVEVAAPRSRQADIESIVNAESPDGRVLSIVVVDGETGIGRIEPALGSGAGGFIDAAATWTIRVLEGDRAVTYLVVDGSDAIFEMTADNMPVQVGGGSAASPDASWPPDGVVDVPMPEGGSGLTRRAGVVDRTGLLVEARAASVNDPRWAHRELQEGEMAIVQITPDTIAAYWNGTLCDDRLVLTVSGDRSSDPPDRLELRGESADRVASHSSTTGWCSSSVSRSTPHRCKARNE